MYGTSDSTVQESISPTHSTNSINLGVQQNFDPAPQKPSRQLRVCTEVKYMYVSFRTTNSYGA